MTSAISELVRLENVFMHVWPANISNDGSRRDSAFEVELISSHTADPSHLDPSCRACRRLQSQLESIARTAMEQAASRVKAELEVYADPACITCSPAGQRPCVTVSIYVRNRPHGSASNGIADSVSQVKSALAALGVRDR